MSALPNQPPGSAPTLPSSNLLPEDLPPTHPPSDFSEPKPESEPDSEAEAEEEEEEEGECGFCLFMKGGGCRDSFINWEKCVQEAEAKDEDLLEKCARVTAALKECMDAHSDYYEPILRAEKMAEEQAIIELEKEKQNSQPNEAQSQQESEETTSSSSSASKDRK
ncbi:hypothetical protein VNO78_12208 [Psophocarpus tetragonolobus]|uniref:GCK domain-containing protein n=1 Tax=Psophocarpus tetragonolobus TaxID=3891 RepID=A0AAN9XP84_PSOTE